jgi:hypothetical protein
MSSPTSFQRPLSADSRFVVFCSESTNLVPSDTNFDADVFVADRLTGTIEIASTSSSGVLGNNWSGYGAMSISADGRLVAFQSAASNLVGSDSNGHVDIFVRDRASGTTERVSVGSAGVETNDYSDAAQISPDGRYVAFWSRATNLVGGDSNQTDDCFVRDRAMATTELVSVGSSGVQGNDHSWYPVISTDGRMVAFDSLASNLVAGDTNGTWDVFLRDRLSGTTILVSVDSAGVHGQGQSFVGGISADGRFIAIQSNAANLVAGDSNGYADIFLHDVLTGTTELVSVSSAGAQGNGSSGPCSISDDGRFVAFASAASNLVSGDTNGAPDVFLHDRLTGSTERISIASTGSEGNAGSSGGWLTPDDRYVLFWSNASNLGANDTNGLRDVFIRDRFASGFTSVCDPGLSGVLDCPCNNPPSGAGRGCENSAATGGASLAASGIAYLSIDSLVFTTADERPNSTSVVVEGTAPVSSGIVFGQGVRCLGGTLKRLYVKTAVNGSITAPEFAAGDLPVSARSAQLGLPIQAGQPYYFLVTYRDPVVPGGCPASSTFNATQTGVVTYWP